MSSDNIFAISPRLTLPSGSNVVSVRPFKYPAKYAFSMYFSGLTRLSGQEAAFLGYIDPMVAILVGCLILREPTTAIQLLGGAMILAFTLIAQLPGKKIHSRAKQ